MDEPIKDEQLITEEFLTHYKDKVAPWGFNGLGYVVYKRTYSRVMENGESEEWQDTIKRCINGAQKIGAGYTKEEAEKLFDYIFNLKCSFGGRMLWQLGTTTVDRFGLASLLNCFAYETEIITASGIKKIGDLSGQTIKVMTENGKWADAPIINFGKQKLLKLKLTRGKTEKEVFCTANHRWFRKARRSGIERDMCSKRIETITSDLLPGDKLFSVYGQSIKNIDPSTFGFAHGIVFGDGALQYDKTAVRLCGDKNKQLLRYFNNSKTYKVENDIVVSNLPQYFKQKPDLGLDKNYLYGWLAGYFAADGNVKKDGQIRLHSAKLENLLYVRDVCAKLGIGYTSITSQNRMGIDEKESELFCLGLSGIDLTEDFFLIEDHLNSFLGHTYSPRMDWKVDSVTETDREEDVFCASVPVTNSFVLESNLLTGNCWFVSMRDPEDFCFLFEHLMLGGGVGYSVKREDIHELPRVKKGIAVTHEATKDADYIVPDSRQGWVHLLRGVLKAFYIKGKSFTYSTILIRGAGERINGFGGTSSGPRILVDGIEKITEIFQGREGKKLRSIDVLDICNLIGGIVVAGNVRRSAEIAIGDPDDYLYLRAKRWDLGNIPNWRSMSNNSIYADDFNHISNEVWGGYEGNGEPYGFINLPLSQKFGRLGEERKDNCEGYNPCVTKDTWVLTSEGPKRVEHLVNKSHFIVNNGFLFNSEKGFFSTGIKQVFKIKTNRGYELKATSNHKLQQYDPESKMHKWTELSQLKVGEYLSIQNHDNFNWGNQEEFHTGWLLGNLVGDGTFSSKSAILTYWGVDKQKILSKAATSIKTEMGGRSDLGSAEYSIRNRKCLSSVKLKKVANQYGIFQNNKYSIEKIEEGSSSLYKGFIAGLFDADGSVQGTQEKGVSIRLSSVSLPLLKSIHRMLSRLGILSSIHENRRAEGIRIMPDGKGSTKEYFCQTARELIISNESVRKYADKIGFSDEKKHNKLEGLLSQYKRKINKDKFFDKILSIEKTGYEEVFDINVALEHSFDANGIVAHNCAEISLGDGEACNLAEIFLNNIENEKELIECSQLLYKTQKAVWTLPALYEKTTKIVTKNMRIGLGVTGVCQSLDKIKWLDNCYKELRAYDKKWSKTRGWPESIKLTTVKPSGTLSLLAGATPGVHPSYAEYYIRRIRMASDDPLIKICKDLNYHTEFVKNFDGTDNRNTTIIEFPCESSGALLAKNIDAIAQLELVKRLQTEWSDNAVSVTVYYKKEELSAIKEWLEKNYKTSIKTVSFLLHSEHGFLQAPYSSITKEEYDTVRAKVKPLTQLQKIATGTLEDLECIGGACPIK